MTQIEHHFDWHGLKFVVKGITLVFVLALVGYVIPNFIANPQQATQLWSGTTQTIASLFGSEEGPPQNIVVSEEPLDIALDVGAGEDSAFVGESGRWGPTCDMDRAGCVTGSERGCASPILS